MKRLIIVLILLVGCTRLEINNTKYNTVSESIDTVFNNKGEVVQIEKTKTTKKTNRTVEYSMLLIVALLVTYIIIKK